MSNVNELTVRVLEHLDAVVEDLKSQLINSGIDTRLAQEVGYRAVVTLAGIEGIRNGQTPENVGGCIKHVMEASRVVTNMYGKPLN